MIARLLSASVLIPLLLLLLLAGTREMLFPLLLLAASLLLWEWLGLMHRPVVLRTFLPVLAPVWLLLCTGHWGAPGWIPLELVLILAGLLSWGLVNYQPGKLVSSIAGFRYMGVIYCGVPLMLLDGIRAMQRGGELICLLLFVIWATDTGALLAGRTLGERKLAPHISPNKTWAGFWGGLGLGTLAGLVSAMGFSLPFSFLEAVVLGGALSFAGQIGDLLESVLKREAGVKDAGALIPGHGGLLDRLDSLLFAVPVFALYLRLRAGGADAGVFLLGG
ncbi:MAG: phosphatidate cytidylyltransferase [Magnetococcales bacterium]|nr:phosphatidate cytidylyltransferase [Magnetococcales bacterium]